LERRLRLVAARHEVTVVELGEQVALLDPVSNPDVKPRHNAGNSRPDAHFGAHARLDDPGRLDDGADVAADDTHDLRALRAILGLGPDRPAPHKRSRSKQGQSDDRNRYPFQPSLWCSVSEAHVSELFLPCDEVKRPGRWNRRGQSHEHVDVLSSGLSLRDVFGPFGYKWTIATREELGPISGDLRFTQLNATVADNGGCEPPQSPTLTKPAVFRGSLPVPVCPQRLIGGLPLDAFDTSSRQEDSRRTKLSRVSRTCASWCVKADRELKMARAEHFDR
jgi:hypothetical protein